MFQPLRLAQAASRASTAQALILVAGGALIAVSIAVRPNNHDEGQYVAAIALMRTGLPYRDFPFLQTPLQPLLLSPLSALPGGWLLVAARAVNGVFGLLTAWLLFRQLSGRVVFRSAAIAIGALLCTECFIFAASQARNDALPILLLAAGQGAMLRALHGQPRSLAYALAGLAFGLAISAKISAALPAGGARLYILLQLRRTCPWPLLAFAGGMIAGLVPCMILAALAPKPFLFGVFTYSLDAPAQWWTSIGDGEVLKPAARVGRLLMLALPGMMAAAMVAAAIDRRRTEDRRLLDLMVAGAIIGSYLPEPAFRQYLVPLLPPLTARLALAIDGLPRVRARIAAFAIPMVSLFGVIPTVLYAALAMRDGPDLVRTVKSARAVAALAAGKPVVTLSPERIAGSDVALDPRFATGPFLFRTFGPLSVDALRYGRSPNWQRINAALDRAPPAVIVVGGETRPFPPLHPRGLDGSLEAWATSHEYRRVALPGGQLTAFVRGDARLQERVGSFPRPMPE